MNRVLRKEIAIPQDHGSWVFILSPLVIGIFAGNSFGLDSVVMVIAAMDAFLLRQPLTTLVKIYSGRRPRTDLPAAVFWTALYCVIGLLAVVGLVLLGDGYVVYLAIPGVPVFAWHLWLVSRRAERKQAGVELIATGVLSLAAPGAYWVGIGRYDPFGWWLWLLTWLQSAASIRYAYLRLEQRVLPAAPDRATQWRMARQAIAYTSFNVVFTVGLGLAGILPRLIFIPYAVQWLEALWGTTHPAVKVKPVRIGMRQTIVSTLWTVLFIVFWEMGRI
ncbi:MAG TPA: YwiC-like family protein [Anaerolineales bacterium]|nr:YwiC-like family protein [Anaerolineales bacterium]